MFYRIEPQFAQATPLSWVWPKGGLTSLSADPTQPGVFYTTDLIAGNKTLEDAFVLGQITLDGVDIGRLSIDGTLAGYIQTTGNIGQIAMGFLWGNIFIDKNLGSLTVYKGGGGFWPKTDTFYRPPDGSLVRVGESLGMINSRGGGSDYHFYTAVQVENKGLSPWPYSDIREIESIVGNNATDYKRYWDFLWRMGYLGYPNFDENDTIPNAQFLSSPDGNFTLTGSIHGYIVVPNVFGTGGSVAEQIDYDYTDIPGPDYYALPLMAGQTFRMEGTIDPEVKISLLDPSGITPGNPNGRVVDTFGYETVEDQGIDSAGTTLKPITFTAPMAGIYYLRVEYIHTYGEFEKADYKLVFTNATKANLGAINIIGDYGHVNSARYYVTPDYINPYDYASGTVAVENGGTLGAISITGGTWGVVYYAHGGGNIVDIDVATLGFSNGYPGFDLIQSDGNIGRVASTAGDMIASIEAGANGGIYNHDAYIQNVFSAGSFGNAFVPESSIPRVFESTFISSSGSIGVIDINGDFGVSGESPTAAQQKSYITIDSDGIGPAGKLDLLDVTGDWTYNSELKAGPAGVVGYVYIGGTIYQPRYGWMIGTPYLNVSSNPSTATITTTSGTLTIRRTELFAVGAIPTYTTASYRLLDVKDLTGGLFASAIVNLVVQGPASLVADGQVYLGSVSVTFTTITGTDPTLEPPAIVFAGNGGGDDRIDIYYISNLASPAATPVTVTNKTPGDLVAGDISGTTVNLNLNGSLGKLDGTVGEMLYGPLAPTTMTTPLYGLFNGTMNGLNVTGDLNAWIGGSVGDLNVTGRLHTLRVNADNTTNEGDWDGIAGVVHATVGIDYVWAGDGLADDGGALLPKAGLFSEGAIYYFGITGPYREVAVPIDASIDQRCAERWFTASLTA